MEEAATQNLASVKEVTTVRNAGTAGEEMEEEPPPPNYDDAINYCDTPGRVRRHPPPSPPPPPPILNVESLFAPPVATLRHRLTLQGYPIVSSSFGHKERAMICPACHQHINTYVKVYSARFVDDFAGTCCFLCFFVVIIVFTMGLAFIFFLCLFCCCPGAWRGQYHHFCPDCRFFIGQTRRSKYRPQHYNDV